MMSWYVVKKKGFVPLRDRQATLIDFDISFRDETQ